MGAVQHDSTADKHLHDAVRSAGDEGLLPDDKPPEIDGVKSVHILFRGNGHDDFVFIDVLREGELDQDAVYVLPGIEFIDERDEFLFRRGFGESVVAGVDSDFVTGLFLGGHIGF